MTNPVLTRTFDDNNKAGWASPTADAWQSDGTTPPPDGYVTSGRQFSIEGVAWKLFGLLALALVTGSMAWQYADPQTVTNRNGDVISSSVNGAIWLPIIVCSLVAFGLAMVAVFKPQAAKFIAPIYALVQGVVLGGISAVFEASYPGIVFQAVLGTIGVAVTCAVLYGTGIIRVTEGFMRVVMVATFGVMITYGINFMLSLFGGPDFGFVNNGGAIGIVVSLVVIVIASMNLIADFHFITVRANMGISKDYEWSSALGLLVTLVWLYLEILRLLSKIRN